MSRVKEEEALPTKSVAQVFRAATSRGLYSLSTRDTEVCVVVCTAFLFGWLLGASQSKGRAKGNLKLFCQLPGESLKGVGECEGLVFFIKLR